MSAEGREAEVPGVDPWGLRRVERLLHTVEGVDSLKIVPDGQGGIDEIHVLSGSGLGAKQIVRNIESALLAQFGLQVDHRKISIAQVRERDLPTRVEEEAVEEKAPPERRLLLDGFQMERKAGERVACRVTLREGEETHEGTAEGPDHAKSRLDTAAQAALRALASARDDTASFALEGVSQMELFGRPFVVVLVQAYEGRRPLTLAGISKVHDSAEEAVVLACLGATNRWAGTL